MGIITYILTLLVTFVGFGLGVALAYIAKEELKQTKIMFRIFQIIVLLAILVFLFSDKFTKLYFITSFMFLFGFPTGSLVFYEKFSEKKISKKTILLYSLVYAAFIIILSILQWI